MKWTYKQELVTEMNTVDGLNQDQYLHGRISDPVFLHHCFIAQQQHSLRNLALLSD